MELIYNNEFYDDRLKETDRFISTIKDELKVFDENLKVREEDIGHGADWPVVLVEIFNEVDWGSVFKIGAIPTIFFLGKKINENLDAWIELSQKLKKLFEKKKPTRIDEKAAFLIIIDLFNQRQYDLQELEISLRVYTYDGHFKRESRLASYPDSLYIFDVKTKESFNIIGLRSDGTIDFRQRYGVHWYDFLDDKK